MNKFLLCALLIILFSGPALAEDAPADYVEGEVIVVMHAPPFCGDAPAYLQVLRNQAEAFAKEFGFALVSVFDNADVAIRTGRSTFLLRSEFEITEELIKKLSSGLDVISVTRNFYVHHHPLPGNSGCNVGYGGTALLVIFVLLAITSKNTRFI